MTSGTVYVLYIRTDLAGALYKIGATANLDKRLASYRALLGDVEPTALIPCDDVYAAEKSLHASLAHCRYEGRSGPQGGRKSELFYLTQRELRALSAVGHIRADGSNIPSADEMFFQRLLELEPSLADLYAEVQAVQDDPALPSFCANRVWYADGGFKDRLVHLVGWGRRDLPADAVLRSRRAYDVAYERLYEVLPSCRNCWCL